MSRDLPQPFRRADGLWVARWTDQTGKRRQVTATTVEAALDKRRRRLAGYDDQQTVGQFLRWWIDVHLPRRVAAGKLSPTTAPRYAALLNGYVLHADLDGCLDQVRLADLAPQHVDDLLDELGRNGSPLKRGKNTGAALSPRTLQFTHAVLRAALNTAVRYQLIPSNPAALVEAPTPNSKPAAFLDPEQATAFLNACRGHRLEALWKVVLPLGLRIGEALAITVDDIDLAAGTVSIAHTIGKVEGRWMRKATKTKDSEQLGLPRFAAEALRRRLEIRDLERMVAGDLWCDAAVVDERGRESTAALLFCRADGSPLWHSTVTRELAALCESAGLPALTPHGLRHSCASILAAQGAELSDIQKLLRHRQARLTSDLYTHLVKSVQRAHMERMDGLVDPD